MTQKRYALRTNFPWHWLTFPAFMLAFLVHAADGQVHPRQHWMLGPFVKVDSVNPCLSPSVAANFHCPVKGANVGWEAKDVFNPAAVVRNGKIYLLYRAQDSTGKPAGTSRIGLAWSSDGMKFTKNDSPVLFPDHDFMTRYEWEGGCEDPRIVEDGHGKFVMTYTAFDSRLARLAVATSTDLLHWKKEGLAFGEFRHGKYCDRWSKSGSIVSRWVNGSPVAVRINRHYWMYWGESDIFLATSDDLIHWNPVENSDGNLVVALRTRKGTFDSRLVEPGPPAMLGESGIVFIYNACNDRSEGDPRIPAGTYAAGQALFSKSNPSKLLARSSTYFFHPERPYEHTGQVSNVCFLEGLVRYRGRWLLYYGTADSRIAVATSGLKGSR